MWVLRPAPCGSCSARCRQRAWERPEVYDRTFDKHGRGCADSMRSNAPAKSIFGKAHDMPLIIRSPKKATLVVRLSGGLGNQMFIYAVARRLAAVNDAELVVDDWSGFARDVVYGSKYALAPFSISARMANRSERLFPFERLRRYIKKRLARKAAFDKAKYILIQKAGAFESQLLDRRLKGVTFIEGIRASEDYFKDIEDLIRQEYAFATPPEPADEPLLQLIAGVPSVAVHFRWFKTSETDNATNLDLGYYEKAFAYVESRIDAPHYFIFSDRPAEAAQALALHGRKFTVVDHASSASSMHRDLRLMSHCRHAIIANSTFSWWGAWLGESGDSVRLVVAPDPRNYPEMGWSSEKLIPHRWKRL
ncbi:alpha-1,2-fucosyltransferase [Rhizorhabdus dicambivorans]|nr:alpha-1,2-fucosyltransferase [Rhizorhabdus dicambivorans]